MDCISDEVGIPYFQAQSPRLLWFPGSLSIWEVTEVQGSSILGITLSPERHFCGPGWYREVHLTKPRAALLVAFTLLAAFTLIYAQAGRKRPAGASNQEIGKAIQQMESELRIAALKADTGWFDVHLSERYTEIDPQGKLLTRADIIQAFRSDLTYDVMNLSDGEASIYNGDTVFLVQKEEIQGGLKGRNFAGYYRCSRLWVKQNGEWQLAATQRTPLPGEAPKAQ